MDPDRVHQWVRLGMTVSLAAMTVWVYSDEIGHMLAPVTRMIRGAWQQWQTDLSRMRDAAIIASDSSVRIYERIAGEALLYLEYCERRRQRHGNT